MDTSLCPVWQNLWQKECSVRQIKMAKILSFWVFARKRKISIVILSELCERKIQEFKIYLKALKSHFKFVDTSLRSVWQENSKVWQRQVSMTKFRDLLEFCGKVCFKFMDCRAERNLTACLAMTNISSKALNFWA